MFHSLYAISVQLSPEVGSSGIQKLEAETFTLHCHQTVTGVKFIVITDPKQVKDDLLKILIFTVLQMLNIIVNAVRAKHRSRL